MVDDIIDGFIR